MVPDGCGAYTMTATKNSGRGIVTSFPPTRESSFRGELEISDEGFGGADVFDVTVTVVCQAGTPITGAQATTGANNVRLSCVHQSQVGATGASLVNSGTACRMGRVEVYNPNVVHENGVGQGTWGTVCGHYYCDSTSSPHRDLIPSAFDMLFVVCCDCRGQQRDGQHRLSTAWFCFRDDLHIRIYTPSAHSSDRRWVSDMRGHRTKHIPVCCRRSASRP